MIPIDPQKLARIVTDYKSIFFDRIHQELYKWKAVHHFQVTWDVHADDFGSMLALSLSKTRNLLDINQGYPRKMILIYARKYPVEVRELFMMLFDESSPVSLRIDRFRQQVNRLHKALYPDGKLQHFQSVSAVCTYLWLRFPDKYYLYRPMVVANLSDVLGSDIRVRGRGGDGAVDAYRQYDAIAEYLTSDEDLRYMLDSVLSPDCYPDYDMKLTASDLGYFLYSRNRKSYTVAGKSRIGYGQDPIMPKNDRITAEPTVIQHDKKAYGRNGFLNEVYMQPEDYDMLVQLVEDKKNIILQGAPGVGKTFSAKRLAYSIIGSRDDGRICLIQFHQNYAYEDFIMGYRPSGDTFALRTGIFCDFCSLAARHPGRKYFLIIDEINRGNLSRIFGELLMLIEKDYRGEEVVLPYSGEKFHVPDNLYIIGLMNTADRSLAMIDYALRRRFGFFDMKPGFDTSGFLKYQAELADERFDNLIQTVKELNGAIASDDSLGAGFEIGHSYFCGREEITEIWLESVVRFDIIPMLREYWFDNKNKIKEWSSKLKQAIL